MSTISLLRRTVRSAKRAMLPGKTVRKMNGGYRVELMPRGDPYERAMYVKREYEPATLGIFDAILRPGDTMVDVGANIGLMSLHAAKCVGAGGRVISVEAHPRYFERLKRNIALNRFAQVTALHFAAGAVDDERQIFDFPDVNIGRSSLVTSPGASAAGLTKVRRLDDLLKIEGAQNVRLWKIDVEGFEAEVIRGAPQLLQSAPAICMEVIHDQPDEGGQHPLSAHDLIMATGLYEAYVFAGSKFEKAPLKPLESRDALTGFHDNVIYLSASMAADLNPSLFA